MRIFFTYVLRLQFKGKYEHFNLIKCHFQKTAVRTGHFELFLINWQKNYNEKKKKNSIFLKNFIRNILQQEIWIYNDKRTHNAQNHGLVHFDANYPNTQGESDFNFTLSQKRGNLRLAYPLWDNTHRIRKIIRAS